MKKILLFIFTFGIIFSLYNVKSKAYAAEIDTTNYSYVIYSNGDAFNYVKFITDGNFPTARYENDRYLAGGYYVTKSNNPTGTTINIVYSQIEADTNTTSLGWLTQYQTTPYDFYYLGYFTNYTGQPLPAPPYTPNIDISQCAFFFEPEPGTDLFSMYCFPMELDDNEVVTVYYNNLNNIGFEITSASVSTLNRCYLDGNTPDYYNNIEYWLEMIDQVKLENDNVIDFLFTTPIYAVYCDFIENNENPNYNIFPLTEESWWDDIVNDIGFEDTELGFIWEWLFGDPDPDYHNVTIDNSPSPTPLPTPIPYRTTLVPDGNGGYEFQYEYEDSNGNTITASAPPDQPNYDGNDLITQPVNMNISGVPVSDVEGVQSLLNVIGEADQEYQEGFQVIGQSFSVLPTKWFMFFGIPAAIILIAGIIKSLLG